MHEASPFEGPRRSFDEAAANIVKREMEAACELDPPLVVDLGQQKKLVGSEISASAHKRALPRRACDDRRRRIHRAAGADQLDPRTCHRHERPAAAIAFTVGTILLIGIVLASGEVGKISALDALMDYLTGGPLRAAYVTAPFSLSFEREVRLGHRPRPLPVS